MSGTGLSKEKIVYQSKYDDFDIEAKIKVWPIADHCHPKGLVNLD
jgi:hypothetical protein